MDQCQISHERRYSPLFRFARTGPYLFSTEIIRNMKKNILVFILTWLTITMQAEVKLPAFFADGMVLQQQTACNLWGTADAGKVVKIVTSWDNKSYKVTAEIGRAH